MQRYGWLDFSHTGKTIIQASHELARALPGIDTIFCSLEEYVAQGMCGEAMKIAITPPPAKTFSDWMAMDPIVVRYVLIRPDMYIERGQIHGVGPTVHHFAEPTPPPPQELPKPSGRSGWGPNVPDVVPRDNH